MNVVSLASSSLLMSSRWTAAVSVTSRTPAVEAAPSDTPVDVLELSETAQAACPDVVCEELTAGQASGSPPLTIVDPAELQAAAEKAAAHRVSRHTDLVGWLFGLSGTEPQIYPQDIALLNERIIHRLRTLDTIVEHEAERLDDKVAGILKTHGIELGEDEKLQMKVHAQTKEIVVSGIANPDKAAAIQEALNTDKTLAGELLVQYARKNLCDQQLVATRQSPLSKLDDRVWGILYDNLLEHETGASMDQLTVGSDGELVTANTKLAAFLDQEYSLRCGIAHFLTEADEKPLEVSFAFAHGTLLDQEALGEQEIGYRLKELQVGIENPWRQYCVDPVLQFGPASIDKFRITIGQFGHLGEIEPVPGEPLSDDDKDLIESWFDGSWAEKISPMQAEIFKQEPEKLLSEEHQKEAKNGPVHLTSDELRQAVANTIEIQRGDALMNEFRQDVVMHDILRQHQFEDGDLENYRHEVQFTFDYHGEASYAVLSEEADAAIQAQIDQLVPTLIEGLEDYFASEGIDTSDALLVQIDERGQLTCNLPENDPRELAVRTAFGRLNAELEQGKRPAGLGAAYDALVKAQKLLADLHDPDNNVRGVLVGGSDD